MTYFKKSRAIEQLLTIIFIWMAMVIVRAGILYIQGVDAKTPFPVDELTQFIDLKLLGSFTAAGLIVFAAFKAFGHRANATERKNSDYYADLALDEIGGVLYNFGALIAVCAYLGAEKLFWLAVPVFWFVGYKLKSCESTSDQTQDQVNG